MKNHMLSFCVFCAAILSSSSMFAASCDEVSILSDTNYGGLDVSVSNIVAVNISDDGKLYFDRQEISDINALEQKVKKAILNVTEEKYYPKVYHKDYRTADGIVTVRGTKYFLTIIFNLSIKTDNPNYQPIVQMYMWVLNSLREQSANQYFHCSYNKLDSDKMQIINQLYPACIYVEHTTPAPAPPVF